PPGDAAAHAPDRRRRTGAPAPHSHPPTPEATCPLVRPACAGTKPPGRPPPAHKRTAGPHHVRARRRQFGVLLAFGGLSGFATAGRGDIHRRGVRDILRL